MIILPQHLFVRLLENGAAPDGTDHVPVVKFFDPCGAATWLITEAVPHEPDTLFGLCDLGMGFPELGYVSLTELKSVKGRLGIGLERDVFFSACFPLSIYAQAARTAERIVEDDAALMQAAAVLDWTPPPGFKVSPPDAEGG